MIGIILGTGYGVYYEIEMKKEEWGQREETNTSTVQTKELAINDELVTSLMEVVHYLNDGLLWDYQTKGKPYFGYWYQKDITSQNEISNQIKLYLALRSLYKDDDWHKNDIVQVPKTDVEYALEKLFGDKNIVHESLNGTGCNYTNFMYDEQTGIYQQESLFCGAILPPHYIAQIEKATKYDDRIEIIEHVAYIDFSESENGENINVYKTNQEKIASLEYTDNEKELLKQYASGLDTYQYTFQLKNGNYYLSAIEKRTNDKVLFLVLQCFHYINLENLLFQNFLVLINLIMNGAQLYSNDYFE